MYAPPGGARFYRRSREVRARTGASVLPLSPARSSPVPRRLSLTFALHKHDPRERSSSPCARECVARVRCAHTRRDTSERELLIKTRRNRLYAAAPFARMLFFHRFCAIDLPRLPTFPKSLRKPLANSRFTLGLFLPRFSMKYEQ